MEINIFMGLSQDNASSILDLGIHDVWKNFEIKAIFHPRGICLPIQYPGYAPAKDGNLV